MKKILGMEKKIGKQKLELYFKNLGVISKILETQKHLKFD